MTGPDPCEFDPAKNGLATRASGCPNQAEIIVGAGGRAAKRRFDSCPLHRDNAAARRKEPYKSHTPSLRRTSVHAVLIRPLRLGPNMGSGLSYLGDP